MTGRLTQLAGRGLGNTSPLEVFANLKPALPDNFLSEEAFTAFGTLGLMGCGGIQGIYDCDSASLCVFRIFKLINLLIPRSLSFLSRRES